MKKSFLLLVIVLSLMGCNKDSDSDFENKTFNPQNSEEFLIFENGNFLSFTDLIDYNQELYCVFREGEAHVCETGIIHIIKYDHSGSWKTEDLIRIQGYDLRDPKFSIDPEGNLCVHFAGIKRIENAVFEIKNFIARFYLNVNDKLTLHTVEEVLVKGVNDVWLWRVVWHNNNAYGVCYSVGDGHNAYLLHSPNGTEYEIITNLISDQIPVDQYITEASLEFSSDNCLKMVARVDLSGKGGNALYGISYPPYTKWEWHSLGYFLGGPKIKTINDKIYIAGRSFLETDNYTVLFELDEENYELNQIWRSSYSGDTGYPGLVYKDKEILMSFYAHLEGTNKSNIYMMRYW